MYCAECVSGKRSDGSMFYGGGRERKRGQRRQKRHKKKF